jgi:hypothetical protein
MKTLMTLAFLMAGACTHAFGLNDIQYWTGSGSNQAGFVLDFNDGQTSYSYAWGFRWNGTATGEDMARAIDASDIRLNLTLPVFAGLGAYMDAATYSPVGGPNHNGATFPAGFFSYWTGAPGTWTSSNIGMTSRSLVNGTWDGFSYSTDTTNFTSTAPRMPIAAVPEPATMSALGLGVLALLRRRKAA